MDLLEFHLTEYEQTFHRDPKDFGGQSCTRWETHIHQRIQAPSGRHVIRHWQRRRELLLDKQVEDLVRVRSWPAKDPLSKLLGRGETLKGLWVCITDDVEDPGSDSKHFILCHDSEEGRECGEIRDLIPFRKSVDGDGQRNDSLAWGQVTYSGRYTMFRSVTKSVARSKDVIRGQPLGDSAVTRLVWANIRRSAGE